MRNLNKYVAMASILAIACTLPLFAHAASTCKGATEVECKGQPACTWREAIVKGETSPRTGNVYKVNRRAHCTTKRVKKADNGMNPRQEAQPTTN